MTPKQLAHYKRRVKRAWAKYECAAVKHKNMVAIEQVIAALEALDAALADIAEEARPQLRAEVRVREL
jgi:hypothetical protein